MSTNLIEHARRELDLIGQTAEDPAYSQSIVAAVAAFTSYPGHSGGSFGCAVAHLVRLLNRENLAPLTDNPDEWEERESPSGDLRWWQGTRNSAAFSHDGGKTYWLLGSKDVTRYSVPVNALPWARDFTATDVGYIIELETGTQIALGHLTPEAFAVAWAQEQEILQTGVEVDPGHVFPIVHRWATISPVGDGAADDEWQLVTSETETPGSFPVTVLHV